MNTFEKLINLGLVDKPRVNPNPHGVRLAVDVSRLNRSGADFVMQYRYATTDLWTAQVVERNGRIVKTEEYSLRLSHTCKYQPDQDKSRCLACARESSGHGLIQLRLMVVVERDVDPEVRSTVQVPCKQHNRRKGSAAYHARVQKKWWKAVEGQTHEVLLRETLMINMSMAQAMWIRRRCYEGRVK